MIFSNLSSFSPSRLSKQIADLYLEDQFLKAAEASDTTNNHDQKIKSRALSSSEIIAYSGHYYSEELDVSYPLLIEQDQLTLSIKATSGEIRAIAKDHLRWGEDTIFKFNRDSNGKISGFVLQSEGIHGLQFIKAPSH